MSLGVLNNINAIYAENNLNNTSTSLSKTLQQLSSGSKINSGADDAAGLSLINGLQANSTALTQSATNASEGVGLLKVADGALSQVTSLLNRAVTLATEVSNGTLSTSQQTAANQEYQSILSEVSNIGSTTTFNGKAVFGSKTDIYTGDSTTTGSSIDSLNIRSLSSASVGDTSGSMSYSNGTNNVFLDLSYNNGTTTTNAQVSDTLSGGSSGSTSITVNYMTAGANGAAVQSSATITAGAGTSYANNAQGLISAINNSGLGISASFGTAADAGTSATTATTSAGGAAAKSTDTGIIISGTGVSTGTTPGLVDTLTVTNKVASTEDTLSGTMTIVGADGKSQTLTLDSTDNTATTLATKINSLGVGITVKDANSGTGDTLTMTSSSSLASITFTPTDVSTGTATNTSAAAGSFYSVGLSASGVYDTSDGEGTTHASGLTADTNGTGTATISYSDSAGQNLSTTSLSSQANAQAALTALNTAITDVSAQDGYVGAQINTLNAVSSVLSTQQENVASAQNSVQATDYAAASSNLSKYEILSQTGISALAQANSVQQEVTKLLQ